MTDAPLAEARRDRADQSIATRFSRLMNASTSPIGVLTDPPVVAVVTAPLVIALLAAVRLEAAPAIVTALEVLAAIPVTVAVVLALALRGARGRVVDWLAGLPFPVENMNSVLNGLGEALEVTYVEACPSTPEMNASLDRVSPESFVLKAPDAPGAAGTGTGAGTEAGTGAAGQPRVIEIRIGVVDSKRNPAASNHQRFVRVRELVEKVIVPGMEKYPVVEVRVK
jgi:hypothetical protein